MLTLPSLLPVDCVLLFNFACFFYYYFQGPFGPVGQKGEVSSATGLIYWCLYSQRSCRSSDQISPLAAIKVPGVISAVCLTLQL